MLRNTPPELDLGDEVDDRGSPLLSLDWGEHDDEPLDTDTEAVAVVAAQALNSATAREVDAVVEATMNWASAGGDLFKGVPTSTSWLNQEDEDENTQNQNVTFENSNIINKAFPELEEVEVDIATEQHQVSDVSSNSGDRKRPNNSSDEVPPQYQEAPSHSVLRRKKKPKGMPKVSRS
jgi:hypothetical protein